MGCDHLSSWQLVLWIFKFCRYNASYYVYPCLQITKHFLIKTPFFVVVIPEEYGVHKACLNVRWVNQHVNNGNVLGTGVNKAGNTANNVYPLFAVHSRFVPFVSLNQPCASYRLYTNLSRQRISTETCYVPRYVNKGPHWVNRKWTVEEDDLRFRHEQRVLNTSGTIIREWGRIFSTLSLKKSSYKA